MSGPQPPRRRRIAGEGKPAVTPTPGTPAPRTPAPGARRPTTRKPAPTAPSIPTVRKDPAAPAAAPRSAPTVPKPRRERPAVPWRRLLPVALASVVLAAGLTAGFLGFTALTEGSTSNEAADEAAAAAGQAAEVIFTYRFDDLDQYADDAVALMTDDYAAEFEQSAPALGEVAADRPFIVEALVRNSAPVPCSEACTDDRVQVLVFYDQFRLADEVSEPTAFGNRITMTMVRSQGTWLVDDIRAL